MADKIPLKVRRTAGDTDALAEMEVGESVGIDHGGTAAVTAPAALANLGAAADADLTDHENDTANPHSVTTSQTGGQPVSEKGNANGYAGLDGGGKVPVAQIPATALPEVHVVADEAARLALTVQEGDEAIQTDDGSHWIYDGTTWFERPGTDTFPLEIQDETVSLTLAAKKINFAGAGVTATEPVADEILVTIPGGGGGGAGLSGFGLWRYQTAITAFPAAGELQFDNVAIDSATELYVHAINDDAVDMTAFLGVVANADLVYIQVQGDATKFIVCQIGVPTLAGSVYTYPLTIVEAQGVAPADDVVVTFLATHSGDAEGAVVEDPITFVAATQATAAVNSLTINVPAGVVDDDELLLFVVNSFDDEGDINSLAGWVEVVANHPAGGAPISTPAMSFFRRVADSEPASYNPTCTNVGDCGMVGKMLAFRKVDPTVQLDVTTELGQHSGTSTPASPPIDPVTNGAAIISVVLHDGDDSVFGGIPAGYIDPDGLGIITTSIPTPNGASLACAYKIPLGSALETPGSFDLTESDEGCTFTIALRPEFPGVSASLDVFGDELQTAESLGESTTTSGTYQEKLTMPIVGIPSGIYLLHWSLVGGNQTTNDGFDTRIHLDNTTILSEMSDDRGAVGGQWEAAYGGHATIALSGNHDIDMDYAVEFGGTALIREARLTLFRIS